MLTAEQIEPILEHLDIQLRGKSQLLISGYAWLLNSYEKGARESENGLKNVVGLDLELEELEEEIKNVKREIRALSGERRRRLGKEEILYFCFACDRYFAAFPPAKKCPYCKADETEIRVVEEETEKR